MCPYEDLRGHVKLDTNNRNPVIGAPCTISASKSFMVALESHV